MPIGFFDTNDSHTPSGELCGHFAPGLIIDIPNQLADTGNGPIDWSSVDTTYEPVAEIYQHRGSYEAVDAPVRAKAGIPSPGRYLQDAWARGTTIGVIASPDHGGGMGRTGVWAAQLTRGTIFDALQARHTFGTTGAKIALWLGCGQAMMGDVILDNDQRTPSFEISVATTHPLAKVELLRNNRVVSSWQPDTNEVDLTWTDEKPSQASRWYYVRVTRADGEMAWSSPIWFLPSSG